MGRSQIVIVSPEADAADDTYEPYFEKEDEVMEAAAAIWGRREPKRRRGDHPRHFIGIINQSWFLYEAGIICSRQADGSVARNSSGERVISLREGAFLLSSQRIKLRRQEMKRPHWEKLPWTGHLCYLFTRAWEIGRAKSQFKRDKNYDMMRDFSESVKRNGCDWMRGQDVPKNWESRHTIDMGGWHEA